MFLGLPSTLLGIVTSYILSTPHTPDELPPLTFHLRHHHALTKDAKVVFSDVPPSSGLTGSNTLIVPRSPVKVHQPSSQSDFHAARESLRTQGFMANPLDWWEDEVAGPSITDRESLLPFAQMAYNAYYADNTTDWYDVEGRGWNQSYPYGWQPWEDGMRGQIFVSSDNSTVVIATKGTSAGWLVGGGGPTVGKDKLNDNLLFSCCCARVGPTWSTVCGCYQGGYKCDAQCVQDSLVSKEDLFYPVGLSLYNNVSYMYPEANIWLTGHSLGGALSSLIGVTFGVPVVAFEAPAEKLAATRLHLPSPPSTQHVTHVYHTADPIPMGACTGVTSSCALGGFAMETRCHLGQVIRFDTVNRLGWSVDVRTHPVKYVIDKLLGPESEWKEEEEQTEPEEGKSWLSLWPRWGKRKDGRNRNDSGKRVRNIPLARPANEVEGDDGVCSDCFNWEFGDFAKPSLNQLGGCQL